MKNVKLVLILVLLIVLFVLRPTTGQVQHKAFFKVGPDAGSQPTHVRQNPKIPSAPSAFPQWGRLRRQEIKQQTFDKTIGELQQLMLEITETIYVCGNKWLIASRLFMFDRNTLNHLCAKNELRVI